MLVLKTWKSTAGASGRMTGTVLATVGQWLVSLSHRSMAVFGLVTVLVLMFVVGHAGVRQDLESWTFDWLRDRQESREPPVVTAETDPAATAETLNTASPAHLGSAQKAVTHWIARRYRVAPEPIGDLVREAWVLGRQAKLEPTLLLAIMAVESSFNPFAQSPVGAQGLMQVMTSVHDDKYQPFGGTQTAFDPITNLRVGLAVLKECIQRAGGSLEGGLRLYVGAANLDDDGGYAARVLAEQDFMHQVSQGRAVPVTVKWTPPASGVLASAIQTLAIPRPDAPAAPQPAAAAASPAPARASGLPSGQGPMSQTPVATPHVAPSPLSKAPSLTEAASVPPSPQVKRPDDKTVVEQVALLQ